MKIFDVERAVLEAEPEFFPVVRETQGKTDARKPSPLEIAEEADHRVVDLPRPLLLGPVTATRQHDGSAELGHEMGEIGDQLVHAGKGHHRVAVAGDVKGRHDDLRPGEGRQELPVAVDVAYQLSPPRNPVRANSAA